MQVCERTKQGRFHSFPTHVSRTARDLISRCLTVDSVKRIYVRHILKHPFFWSVEDDSDVNEEGECSGEEEDDACGLAQEGASGDGLSSCGSEL